MVTLRALRLVRSLRRRVIGKRVPHWARDVFRLVHLVNVFRYLPTLQAMVCYPNHFYKSIPAILANKKPYYVTPVSFIAGAAALELFVYKLVLGDSLPYSKQTMVLVNAVAALLSPVVAVALCAAALILARVARPHLPFGDVIDLLSASAVGAQVAVDYRSYLKLDGPRFAWSMFYYSVYFFVVAGVLLVLGGLLLSAIAESAGPSYLPNRLELIEVAALAYVFAQACYALLARPYAYILCHSSRQKSEAMWDLLESDVVHEEIDTGGIYIPTYISRSPLAELVLPDEYTDEDASESGGGDITMTSSFGVTRVARVLIGVGVAGGGLTAIPFLVFSRQWVLLPIAVAVTLLGVNLCSHGATSQGLVARLRYSRKRDGGATS